MSLNIVALQMAQDEHNRRQHPDVSDRNILTQQGHYLVHLQKYIGKLQAMILTEPHAETSASLKKVWIDTTLICLSLANCMSHHITLKQLDEMPRIPFSSLIKAPEMPIKSFSETSTLSFFNTYSALLNGVLASAFDKLHHGECSVPHYTAIREACDELFHTCRLIAHKMNWDVEQEVRSKHHHIFQSKIK